MSEIEARAAREAMYPMVAVLSLFGVVTALVAVSAAFLLASPWSAIVAVLACIVAGGCVGAAVAVVRARHAGEAS